MTLMSIVCAGLVAGVVASADRYPTPPDSLNGAWRLVEMRVIAPDGTSVAVPVHESLIIFADGYYSIGYAFGEGGSAPYAER